MYLKDESLLVEVKSFIEVLDFSEDASLISHNNHFSCSSIVVHVVYHYL